MHKNTPKLSTIIWHIQCLPPSSGINGDYSWFIVMQEGLHISNNNKLHTEGLTSVITRPCVSAWRTGLQTPAGRILPTDHSLARSDLESPRIPCTTIANDLFLLDIIVTSSVLSSVSVVDLTLSLNFAFSLLMNYDTIYSLQCIKAVRLTNRHRDNVPRLSQQRGLVTEGRGDLKDEGDTMAIMAAFNHSPSVYSALTLKTQSLALCSRQLGNLYHLRKRQCPSDKARSEISL